MLTYIARRILYSIPVLFLSTFLSFSSSRTQATRSGTCATTRDLQNTLHLILIHNHLDRSVPVRYWFWLKDLVTHKLGNSLLTFQPIWPDITRTLGHTAQVIIISEALAIVLGVAVGIFSAIRQYSVFDYVFTSLSFLGYAMPVFWFALLLQVLFVDIYLKWHLRIFYTSGLNTPGQGTWSLDRLQHIALPVVTLCVVSFALYSRYMRASMLDVINSDYVRTARAKGVPEWRVIMHHVFRNALIPIVTVAALNLGGLLGGAIITETIFTLDGIGYYFIQSLQGSDYLRGDGVPRRDRGHHHRVQPDRRHPLRLSRSANPV